MNSGRLLKIVHVSSTGCFTLSGIFLVIIALRQAGMNWWIIFSLSGHSTILIFFLTLVYIFAVFRGASSSRNIEIEHPLTSSKSYMTFYDVSPFLGAIAGLATFDEISNVTEQLISVATGSLTATFMVWVIFDPAISVIETLLPESRKHLKKRLAEAKAAQLHQKQENEKMLNQLLKKEEQVRKERQKQIEPLAAELACLLEEQNCSAGINIEKQAVEIGAKAWKLGGISCMRQLHEKAIKIYRKKNQLSQMVDHIAIWWDGIGSWQRPQILLRSKQQRKKL